MANFVLENYIDSELCNQLIEEFTKRNAPWTNSSRGYYLISSNDMAPELLDRYIKAIKPLISDYLKYFPGAFEGFAGLTVEQPFNLQKYEPGNHYSTWHCENNGHSMFKNRVLAFMTYLNTVENGGETEFLYQKMKARPKIGKTLVWPAYFTHTHRGLPAETETKYIVTGWIEVTPWKDVDMDMSDEDFFSNLNQDTEVTW
jgi:hypothetical protein